MSSRVYADPVELDLVAVMGKGGVGKTAVSAALAMAAAERGKRVLLAMCNVKERLSRFLEVEPIGPDHREVLPRIDAVNMRPDHALEEYGVMVLKTRRLYRAIFENRFVASFLRGTPGIEAWSMLGKACFHAREHTENGARRYDLVILDAPATGHGLELLRVPSVLGEVAPPGLLRQEAEAAQALFRDRSRFGAILVTLAEELPTNEALELEGALREDLGVGVCRLVVNGLVPTLFNPEARARLTELEGQVPPSSPLFPALRAGRSRAAWEARQQTHLERLQANIGAPLIRFPHLFVPELRRANVADLAREVQ